MKKTSKGFYVVNLLRPLPIKLVFGDHDTAAKAVSRYTILIPLVIVPWVFFVNSLSNSGVIGLWGVILLAALLMPIGLTLTYAIMPSRIIYKPELHGDTNE